MTRRNYQNDPALSPPRSAFGRKPARRKLSAIPTETQLQYEVAGFLASHLMPPFLFWHTPNGGKRGLLEASRLKRMGVKPGVQDIFIFGRARLYAIELKREKGGSVSAAQKQFHTDFAAAGGVTEVCKTLDEVRAALAKWGVPLFVNGRLAGDPIMAVMRNAFDVVS